MRFFASFALALIAPALVAQPRCDSDRLTDRARAQCERGRQDATAHLAVGAPEWHWWGIPDYTSPVADSLLRGRYGLLPVFHGDIVSDYEDHYTASYNAVVHDRLSPRFGDDFASRAFADARAYFPGDEVLNPEVLQSSTAPIGACAETKSCLAIVRVMIAPDGEPYELQVVKSSDAALDAPALAAVSQVKFRPASDVENGRSLNAYGLVVKFTRR